MLPICVDDVRVMVSVINPYYSDCFIGKNPTEDYLEAMMNEAPGPINFTMFLTMFGEKLNGTDPEDVIRNAFACFDEEGTGELEVFFVFSFRLCTVPPDAFPRCLQTQFYQDMFLTH